MKIQFCKGKGNNVNIDWPTMVPRLGEWVELGCSRFGNTSSKPDKASEMHGKVIEVTWWRDGTVSVELD